MSEKNRKPSIRDSILQLNRQAREMEEKPAPKQKKHRQIVYHYRIERVRRIDENEKKPAQAAQKPEEKKLNETGRNTDDTKEIVGAAKALEKTAEFPSVGTKREDSSQKTGEFESGYVPAGARERRHDTGEISYVYNDDPPAEIPEEHLVPPVTDEDEEDEVSYDDLLDSLASDEEAEEKPRQEKKKPEKRKDTGTDTMPDFELTSLGQRKEVLSRYRRADRANRVRIGLCAVLLLLASLYETLPLIVGTAADLMDPRVFPVTYVMIDLQLLFFGAALIPKNLARGAVNLLRLQPDPDSITVVMLTATVAYDVLMCTRPYGTEFRLYHFPMLLCILLSLLYEFFTRRREAYSVEIATSRRLKFTVGRLDTENAGLEMEVFGDYLGEDPSIFKIEKTQFVTGVFRRLHAVSGVRKTLLLMLPLGIAFGVGFAMAGILRLDSTVDGITVGYTALMLSLPAASLLTFSYPFYHTANRAHRLGSAILGEAALDAYADASSVSFNDREVFPGNSVKVRSIKVFGRNRVDTVIYNVASVFRLVGGPLRDVFDIATADLGQSSDVRVLSVDPGGIEAAVSGTHLYIGKREYLRRNHYAPIVDDEDGQVGSASIMYIVMDDEVVAKMYIQYRIDKDFEGMLRQLYKYGVCVGIQTFDPNIDDEMLSRRIRIQKYPVRVLKCREVGDRVDVAGQTDSGILSVHSAKNLLRTFTYCRKTKRMLHTGAVLNFISLFSVIPVMLLALLFGGAHTVPSFYVVLYQLFWSAAVMLTPYFAAK